ncbi:hypothetical protein BC936DRAFT_144372, partial [Jimgerdemannia flammicorona]
FELGAPCTWTLRPRSSSTSPRFSSSSSAITTAAGILTPPLQASPSPTPLLSSSSGNGPSARGWMSARPWLVSSMAKGRRG